MHRAAETVRERLYELAAERLGVQPDALALSGGRIYIEDDPNQGLSFKQLGALSVNSRGGPIIGTSSLSNMPYDPVFSTQAAEVIVDRATGQVKVTRYMQAQDVGVAINPMSVEGQLEGGVVQGIGRALTEDMQLDAETGAVSCLLYTSDAADE